MIETIDEEEDAHLKKMPLEGSSASPDSFFYFRTTLSV